MNKAALLFPLLLCSCTGSSSFSSESPAPMLEAPKISIDGYEDGYGKYKPDYRSDGTEIAIPQSCDRSCEVVIRGPRETNGYKDVIERTAVPYGDGSFEVKVDFPKEYTLGACLVYFDKDGQWSVYSRRPSQWYGRDSTFYETEDTREVENGIVTIGNLETTEFAYLALSIQFSSPYYGRGSTTFLLSDPRV